MYGCVSQACLVSEGEVGKGHQGLWSWNYRWWGYWEPNLSSLQEQQISLTPEPSPQPLVCSETELWFVLLDDLEFNREARLASII